MKDMRQPNTVRSRRSMVSGEQIPHDQSSFSEGELKTDMSAMRRLGFLLRACSWPRGVGGYVATNTRPIRGRALLEGFGATMTNYAGCPGLGNLPRHGHQRIGTNAIAIRKAQNDDNDAVIRSFSPVHCKCHYLVPMPSPYNSLQTYIIRVAPV